MREIRFRAYDKQVNKMFAVKDILFQSDTVIGAGGIYPRGSLELMQYTGLKDKNGKEVYEGDIVTYLNCYTQKMLNKQIIWDKYSCGFTCDPLGHQNLWYLQEYLKDNKFDLEVIGNIYENKELLKSGI